MYVCMYVRMMYTKTLCVYSDKKIYMFTISLQLFKYIHMDINSFVKFVNFRKLNFCTIERVEEEGEKRNIR